MGKLLLHPEPFIFEGATITITEQPRRPFKQQAKPAQESALTFAPRTRKPGKALGKGRGGADKPTFVPASGQDDFRALVDTKNKQREGNLAVKRGAGADDGNEAPEAKRAKQ